MAKDRVKLKELIGKTIVDAEVFEISDPSEIILQLDFGEELVWWFSARSPAPTAESALLVGDRLEPNNERRFEGKRNA